MSLDYPPVSQPDPYEYRSNTRWDTIINSDFELALAVAVDANFLRSYPGQVQQCSRYIRDRQRGTYQDIVEQQIRSVIEALISKQITTITEPFYTLSSFLNNPTLQELLTCDQIAELQRMTSQLRGRNEVIES